MAPLRVLLFLGKHEAGITQLLLALGYDFLFRHGSSHLGPVTHGLPEKEHGSESDNIAQEFHKMDATLRPTKPGMHFLDDSTLDGQAFQLGKPLDNGEASTERRLAH